ncbi:DUF397 domain-containing protein [Amycolatopsis rhabdoformis]|uniref:DUF397 domain-containing protein n=1 Tax=Amycolatopsis rhabdoformis TaxID=1448059 RepID=A0ABZ1IAM1_9PSEU|nr:DUF397 domain-containing protein [Amycolatopsis rhabdoformis]WSE31059.1 DUF397 domain-containing protein [Amycolatopsis rhabdoformis]
MTSDFQWRKSSFSGNPQQECVEVGFPAAGPLVAVAVRDSKDPGAGHFELSPAGWRGFLEQVGQDSADR